MTVEGVQVHYKYPPRFVWEYLQFVSFVHVSVSLLYLANGLDQDRVANPNLHAFVLCSKTVASHVYALQ